MAVIKIIGDAVVVTGAVKKEKLEKLQKYNPKSLKLYEMADGKETKNEVFAIGIGASPSFTKHGIVYSGVNAEGFPTATFQLEPGLEPEKKAEIVRDKYGYALLNLNTLESRLDLAAATIDADIKAIEDNIVIAD